MCDCVIVQGKYNNHEIEYCPLHAAAEEMFKLLDKWYDKVDDDHQSPGCHYCGAFTPIDPDTGRRTDGVDHDEDCIALRTIELIEAQYNET